MAEVALTFGGKEIKTYQLTKPATVVGRDASVDIVIDNLGVSRSHCQFLRRGTAFILQDMNSSNGTYVNGQKVGEHYLNNGDQVMVGKYVLVYKNEQQSTADVAAAEKIVPDSLNTYMMDGDKIRQRLEEMRRAQEGAPQKAPAAKPGVPAAAPAPAPASPIAVPAAASAPAPAQSQADRAERHTRIIMGGGGNAGPSMDTLKKYLYFSLAVNIVLALALCVLLVIWFSSQKPA
jgi:predicted component of type VI protein secretion system